MFTTKCQVQNDRTNYEKISCFCQNLDFTLYFTIKTSIFKLRSLFRFLCLINSFYRRYVSCMYNRSNISNKSNISIISDWPTIQPLSNHYPPLSNHYPTTIQPLSTTIQPLSTTIQPLSNHYPPLSTTIQPLSNHYLRTNRTNISPR